MTGLALGTDSILLSDSRRDASPLSHLPLCQKPKLISQDVSEVHRHMENAICSHDLAIHRGTEFSFVHRGTSVGRLALNAIYYGGSAVRVYAPPLKSRYIVQFSLSGSSRILHQGRTTEVSSGSIFVINPAFEHEQLLGEDYTHFNILVPCTLVNRILYNDLYAELDEPINFEECRAQSHAGAASLWRYVSALCSDLNGDSPVMAHPRVAATVEECFARLLLAGIPNSCSEQFDNAAHAPAPFYVRRAEEYIRQHAVDDITLDDLVQAAGVSTRTLHAGFRTYRDTTPMAHLKNRRLDLAHAQLKQARDQGLSVTDVAMNCGLNHLSKFARDYQRRFGESPSTTRRRGS